MKVNDRRTSARCRCLPFICVLIAVATSVTSLLKGKAPEMAGSDSASTEAESLILPFEQHYKRVAEDAWEKYKVALLQAKESAFKDANLDLLNKIDSELLYPTAAPRDWPSGLLRKACNTYYETLDSAVSKYSQEIDRLITEQLRGRDLEAANALDRIRSSLDTARREITAQGSNSRYVLVEDFEGEAFSMIPYAAGTESGVYRDGSKAAMIADAPHSLAHGKSKGLRFDWPSPHGEWIGAHYEGKRAPFFDSSDLTVRFSLWLSGSAAPPTAEVHFSDKDGEVFTFDAVIQAPDQRGWRWVVVPVQWGKHRVVFGGFPGNGVVDFPVSLFAYSFLFQGKQTPSSWLLIDNVSVAQKKSGASQP